MKPGALNFEIFPGCRLSKVLNIDGMDLTGWTARAKMRATWDEDISFEFTCSLAPGAASTWDLTISATSAETTEIVRPSNAHPTAKVSYFWDCELVDADGESDQLLRGNVVVYPEATR